MPGLYNLATSTRFHDDLVPGADGYRSFAMVAGVKRSSGYIAVFGWWALLLIVQFGAASPSR